MGDLLYRYLIVFVACVALLLGLQLPNFVDQYQKRVDAHLREVTINLQAFQTIADKYFAGDLHKLIALHRNSSEPPFVAEGDAIEMMLQRKLRFEADMAALQASLPVKTFRVLFHGDREMLDETLGQFSYNAPLSKDALLFGATFALFILILLELLLALARRLTRKTYPSQVKAL